MSFAAQLVATDAYKWYWWIAPILAGSFIVVVLMLSAGYVRKVMVPKYRGRRIEELPPWSRHR